MVLFRDILKLAAEKAEERLLKDNIPFKGHCQDGVAVVLEELKNYGIRGKPVSLSYHSEGCPDGRHIIVEAFGKYIDPTIKQFFPDENKLVFEKTQYPLTITRVEDLTHYISFFKYKNS